MEVTNHKVEMTILTPKEGGYITNHAKGDDIKEYVGSKIVYLPAGVDSAQFREITTDEHLIYEASRNVAIGADMAANMPRYEQK